MTSRTAAMIAGAMLLLLGLDTLPLPIVAAQVAPAASLIAIVTLPLALRRFQVTPLFGIIIAFYAYVVAHSAIALVVDYGIAGQPAGRAGAWVRQLVALTAGVAVFVVLRTALRDLAEKRMRWFVLVGAIPAVAMGLLNLLWGTTWNPVAGRIVVIVRNFVAPYGFTSPVRASGLSVEPAVFALFLTLVVLPFMVLALYESRRRLSLFMFLGLTLLAFAWTFSATGAGVLFILCMVGLVLGPERPAFAAAVGVATLSVLLLLMAVPNNYAVAQVTSVLRGDLDLSATTKFFSTLEPLWRMDSSLISAGYGLGGSPFHLREIVSEQTYSDIAAVSWASTPNLKTLWGRLLAETGLIGAALVVAILGVAWSQVRKLGSLRKNERRMARMALTVAITYFLGASVASGLASFALPTFWFWLAVIDSRYLMAHGGASPAPTGAADHSSLLASPI